MASLRPSTVKPAGWAAFLAIIPIVVWGLVVVASELRVRLASAFAAASIGMGRWATPLPITTQGSGASPP